MKYCSRLGVPMEFPERRAIYASVEREIVRETRLQRQQSVLGDFPRVKSLESLGSTRTADKKKRQFDDCPGWWCSKWKGK